MARRTLAGLLWLALLCWACGILVLSSLTPKDLPTRRSSSGTKPTISLLQTFTPGRSGGDIFDWTADLLGAVAGALVRLLTDGRLERLLPRP